MKLDCTAVYVVLLLGEGCLGPAGILDSTALGILEPRRIEHHNHRPDLGVIF